MNGARIGIREGGDLGLLEKLGELVRLWWC